MHDSFFWQIFLSFMVDYICRERERKRKRIEKSLIVWENIHKQVKISDLEIFLTLIKAVTSVSSILSIDS